VNVEFLQRSSLKNSVSSIIPFLKDDAEGYHPASGHVDSLASLLIRPAAFADSKFLSPFPKRLKSPHPMREGIILWDVSQRRCLRTATIAPTLG
jgi:hypothetical protein